MQPYESLKEISREFTEKTLQNGAISFSLLVANESAPKSIVLVHGVTGNKYDMVVVGREYARRGYAVYIPDLPGHGAAPFMEVYSFTDLSKWLHVFITSIGRTPDVLMGNSFGSPTKHYTVRIPTVRASGRSPRGVLVRASQSLV